MKGSVRRERSFNTAESEVVRKNRIFEIQINLAHRFFLFRKNHRAQSVVSMPTAGATYRRLKLTDFPFTRPYLPFLMRESPPLRLVSSADASTHRCCRSDRPTTPPSPPCAIRAR